MRIFCSEDPVTNGSFLLAPRTDLNENFERGGGDLAPPDNAGGGGNENQFSVWRSEDYEYSLDSS